MTRTKQYTVYGLSLDGRDIRYVGLTIRGIEYRLRVHRTAARAGRKLPLYRWMRKHGPENVQTRVLCHTSNLEDLGLAERWWIAALREDGYRLLNLTDGGEGVLGLVVSAETRARISAAHKGKKLTDEHKARAGAALKDRKFTDEHRARISAAGKGRTASEETRAKMSATRKGKKHTAERIAAVIAGKARKKAERDSGTTG